MRRAVLLLAVVAACADAGATAPAGAAASDEPTLAVERGDFVGRLLLTGEVDAADSVELTGPRTDDWNIGIRWLAEDGAQVAAGDRVIGFDNTSVLGRLRELELSVVEAANARGEQAAKSQVAIEEKAFEVEKQRVAVAKAELDAQVPSTLLSRREAHNFALALARAEVALATATSDAQAARSGAGLEAEVKRIAFDKAERALKAAELQLQGLDLVAPRDGIFIIGDHPWEGRKMQVGDNVWPGVTVARLPDLSKLVVRARLDDVDDGRVMPGQSVTCFVDAWPDAPLPGHVVSVSPVAHEMAQQSTRRYFTVEVELGAAPAGTLRPGLSVRVEVQTQVIEDALLVPRVAIAFDGGTARAHLADGSTVELALVACDAQRCAIEGGLDEGTALRVATEAR